MRIFNHISKYSIEVLCASILCLALFYGCEMSSSQEDTPLTEAEQEVKALVKEEAFEASGKDLAYLDRVLLKAKKLKNSRHKAEFLIDLSALYYEEGALESFLDINSQVFEQSELINDTTSLARAYYDLGYYYYSRQIDSSYKNFYKAERLYASMDSLRRAGMSRLTMAIIQKNARDYQGASSSTVKAIEYFEPMKENSSQDKLRFLASSNNNLGTIEKEIHGYEKAIAYHEKALAYRTQMKDKPMYEVSSLSNLGVTYSNMGDYNKAIEYYERGLGYDSLAIKRPRTYARLLDNLAYAKFKLGALENVRQGLDKALQLREANNDMLGGVTSHIHLAEYYQHLKDTLNIQRHALIAYKDASAKKYMKGALEAAEILVKIAQPKEAVVYAQRHMAITDSLQRVERSSQDQFARIRFETDTLETEKTAATQKVKRLTLYLLGTVSLLLFGYILLQNRINKKSHQLREEQQKASEEIMEMMMSAKSKLEEGKQLEKLRISEELHDGVLGRLFGIRLNLDSLNLRKDPEAPSLRARYLEDLKALGHEIREISHELNEYEYSSGMLYIDVVEKLVRDQSYGLEYTFTNDPDIDWEEVPNSTKAHMYRLIQESLQNIHKHAEATELSVVFQNEEGKIALRISDNGKGMEKKAKKGIGLKNMTSRVRKIKGQLYINSTKGEGTTVYVQLE